MILKISSQVGYEPPTEITSLALCYLSYQELRYLNCINLPKLFFDPYWEIFRKCMIGRTLKMNGWWLIGQNSFVLCQMINFCQNFLCLPYSIYLFCLFPPYFPNYASSPLAIIFNHCFHQGFECKILTHWQGKPLKPSIL